MPFPGYYDPTATQVAAGTIASPGLSSKLWRDVNVNLAANNPAYGRFMFDRFDDLVQATQVATAGTELFNGPRAVDVVTDADGQLAIIDGLLGADGRCASLDSETTVDTEGVTVAWPGWACTPKAGFDIIFECRVTAGSATLGEHFMGLSASAIGTEIIASDALVTTADHAGFYSLLAGAVDFSIGDGTTTAETATAIHTLVNYNTASTGLTWVKLGCRYSGTKDGNEHYVNGVKGTEVVTQTVGPNTAVWPQMVSQSNGTTTGVLYVDWVAMAQVPSGNA